MHVFTGLSLALFRGETRMLRIECQSCQHVFEVAASAAGTAAIVGGANVFKIRYDRVLPCARCAAVLQLEIRGPKIYGLPKTANAVEKTEFALHPTAEATEVAPAPLANPGPTVRVKIGALAEQGAAIQAQTKVKPFRILSDENAPRRISMYKAKIEPVRPRGASLRKHGPIIGIGVGLALTFVLIFSSAWSSKGGANRADIQGMAQESLEDELAEGGPPEDVVLNEETPSTRDPLAELKHAPAILELPSINSLTSGFGIRLDPFSHRLAFHGGIDFKANTGAKVVASLDGKVIFAGRNGKYGNLIRIAHPGGYETRYAHLSNIKVTKGQKVKKGTLIGLVGSTGRSTGPHLHFELMKNGKKIDPLVAELKLPKVE